MENETEVIWCGISGFSNDKELRKFLENSTAEEVAEWFKGFRKRFEQDMTETLADIRACVIRTAEVEVSIHNLFGGTMH